MKELQPMNGNGEMSKIILFILIFVSPILVLQIYNKELFLWMQLFFVLFFCIKYKRITVVKSPLIVFLFIEPLVSGLFALISEMPAAYKKTAINLPIMAIPLYISICCITKMIGKSKNTIEIIVKALRSVVIVEIVWFIVQIIFYKFMGIDINKLVFVDTFHMLKNASFVRSWIWYPSGLSWHSAVLAPLFIIGILLFDNTIIRILILLEAFLCGNSTALLGNIFCLMLLGFYTLYTQKIKIRKKQIVMFLLIILIFCIAVLTTDIGETLSIVLTKLWIRLFGADKDASTAAHFGYYSDYLKIVKQSTLSQFLLGYGTGCSGYTITSLYGRYADGGTWAIESDYVNILVSRGIIGFISYYCFLLCILFKGIKIDRRYGIFILTVLFQGFGYNIQFDYLLLIEMVMYISIFKHINFFDIVDNLNRKKKKRGKYGEGFDNSYYI